MALFSVVMGIMLVCIGTAFMYIIPDYIIKALNDTAVFTGTTVATANTQLGTIRGVGFATVVIGAIWLIVSTVAGVGGKR